MGENAADTFLIEVFLVGGGGGVNSRHLSN